MEMKKPIGVALGILLVLSVMTVAVPAVRAHTESEPFRTDLLAGKSIDVGDVLVWNDEDYLYVKYVTTGSWYISEVHLEVATSLDKIPQAKGNPTPGKFTYGEEGLWTQEYPFDPIPLTWDKGTPLYIAAHAKVWDAASLKTDVYESENNSAQVYGPVNSYLPLNDPGWGTPKLAVETWKHGSWPLIPGSSAVWISSTYYIEDPRYDSWRKFTVTLNVPGYPAGGSVVTATADNAEEVYLNGAKIGSDGTVNVPFNASGGDPHEWKTIKDYPFMPVQGTNKLEFIVHNYAYFTDDPKINPTGLIYKVSVSYYTRSETAWGAGLAFSGKNWATYFTYTVQGWTLIETIDVPADGTKKTSINDLQAGHEYKFVASGTCNWRVPGSTNGYLGDAEYWFRHDAYGEGWTKMGIWSLARWDGTAVDIYWGDFNEDHVYTVYFTPSSTGTVTFFFNDDVYTDNSGSLTVRIYEWS